MTRPGSSYSQHYETSSETLPDENMATKQSERLTEATDYPTPSSLGDSQGTPQGTFKFSKSASAALSNISEEPKKLLKAIDSISSLGIESHIRDLPKIVAIGDQSAGKSSVIAAVCGVTVPRNSGTCTRCPAHINLHSQNGQWKCIVSLERHYFLGEHQQWLEYETPQPIEFASVDQPEDLEDVMVRAQAAILNPGQEPNSFVNAPKSVLKRNQVEFSPNLIRLDIWGPECADLTFYDLPGLFSQTKHKEQQHLAGLVRDLVLRYMLSENHLLLLARSMESDFETGLTPRMVSDNGLEHRCVGILTKPDRLAEGTPPEEVRALLQGETYKLGHGYFVTKQPSQVDLNKGIDHGQAREDEAKFFQTHAPWAKDFVAYQNRFGTRSLQAKLSELLVGLIREQIPSLLEKVNNRLELVDKDLGKLPDPPNGRSLSIIIKLIAELHNHLDLFMQGELPHNRFIMKWKDELCRKFDENLKMQKPTLAVLSNEESKLREKFRNAEEEARASSLGPSTAINLVDSDDEQKPSPQRPAKRSAGTPSVTPQKKRQRVQQPTPRPSNTSGAEASPGPSRSNGSNGSLGRKPFPLDQVRDIRMLYSTSAIGHHDHRSDEYLIQMSLQHWKEVLDEFIKDVKKEVVGMTQWMLNLQLRDWEKTALAKELRDHVSNYIEEATERHRGFAHRLVDAEMIKPMTLNTEHHKASVQREKDSLRETRHKTRLNLYQDDLELKSGKFTRGADRENKIEALKKQDILGPDPYADEIDTMARVRGYYNVASAAFVDSVCKAMRLDIFEQMRNGLKDSVESKFKLNDDDGLEECKRLLAEEGARTEQRRYLQAEKAKFEKAKKSLDELVKSAHTH